MVGQRRANAAASKSGNGNDQQLAGNDPPGPTRGELRKVCSGCEAGHEGLLSVTGGDERLVSSLVLPLVLPKGG